MDQVKSRRFKITLFLDIEAQGDPQKWDWETLLDLGPKEKLIRLSVKEILTARDEDYPCPGCGCLPGEGRTPGCMNPDGCGFNGG